MINESYTDALEHVDVYSVDAEELEKNLEELPVIDEPVVKKAKKVKAVYAAPMVFGDGVGAYISVANQEKICAYISSYSGCHLTYAPLSGLVSVLEPKTSSTYAYAFNNLMWNVPAGAGMNHDDVAAYVLANLA